MSIAVLGAGLAGVLTALELAEAGYQVELFDRCAQPLRRSSENGEGKIHLGYVYALARTMLQGAACFHTGLERWLESELLQSTQSQPFIYAVPQDSLLSVEQIRAYFARLAQLSSALGYRPLQHRELAQPECQELFDPQSIQTAFQTEEIAVNTPKICQRLRQVLAHVKRIELRMATHIQRVQPLPSGEYRVYSSGPDGERQTDYPVVVNALWEQRLAIDASAGFTTTRPVIHRFKVGVRNSHPHALATMPSVTFLIGPYGDTVNYGDAVYASWYPTGLLIQELALTPSRLDVVLDAAQQQALIHASLQALQQRIPAAAASLDPQLPGWQLCGGYISAWGQQGIEQRSSELHQRYAVGVHSHANYHSLDTGKLTLAPWFAAQVCQRIQQSYPCVRI